MNGYTEAVPCPELTMNTATDTLTDEVEPFLLRAELVVRTPRRRKLTAAGYGHLGATPPAESVRFRSDGALPLFEEETE